MIEIELPELPEGYQDALHTVVDVHLSFVDRIKVLFGYRLTVNVDIVTEHKPGETITESKVIVWKPGNSKRLAVVTADSDDCVYKDGDDYFISYGNRTHGPFVSFEEANGVFDTMLRETYE